MSLLKKVKDILFEEEEYTEPIKVTKETKEETPKIVKIEQPREEVKVKEEPKEFEIPVEPMPKRETSFQFPDFDEEEFMSNISKPKPNKNVLEYERKKTVEKRTDYGRYERVETKEIVEKKKFKPSPIISPVYGILNQDYRAEDIVNRNNSSSNIDIEAVRKKAFEPKEVKTEEKEEKIDTISEPVVTFFGEKEEVKVKKQPKEEYKSIDDLLEEASTEIDLEDTIEIPKESNLDAIEEELEKLDVEEKKPSKEDDELDNDLFELIDSMYDDREEV